ncbi:hypothetical protein [Thermoflexibacter ruber]|uniref:Uncharacterized protein n=1 Tax=Thermoflexibacter ruber TaxID=1003 RepID=A0A1I2JQM0_9BACT|nr:hypothetical protein [Thermoflexibacter ruber]SFF56509.1 hypothetical protein SAMN04488541_105912 [Thermoflexibacter ruber]
MKNAFFLSVFIFLLVSCKKETNPEFSGNATMKINGNATQMRIESVWPFASNIVNVKFSGENSINLNLTIQKTGDIERNKNTNFPFGITSGDNAGASLVTEGISGEYVFVTSPKTLGVEQGSVNISKWTDNEVEGSFNFIAVGQSKTDVKVNVTEGKFYVKRK